MLSKVEILKEKILKEIKTGRVKPNEPLPSRHQFMKKYDCARGSIDAAIKGLASSGYVYSRKGQGTFVADLKACEHVKAVYLIGDYAQGARGGGWASTPLASEIQRHIPCFVIHRDEVNVNLQRITQAGNAVIWVRPRYSDLMIMDYLALADVPQLLIGRNFGNFDHVRTDAEAGIQSGLIWLKEHGGPEVVYISEENNPDFPYIAERHLAFFTGSLKAGIKLRDKHVIIDSRLNGGNPGEALGGIIERLMLFEKFPRAVFLSFISASSPFVSMLEAKGKIPGRDYHLLIFDYDMWLRGREGVAMIRQDWNGMEKMASEWVLKKIKGFKGEFKKKIKPQIIVKESTV